MAVRIRDGPRRAAWLAASALAAALTLTASSCGSTASKTTSAASPVQITQVSRDRWAYARARFREMCAGCHTLADAGATGPRYNLDSDRDINEQLVRETILRGGPGMPPWASLISYREWEQLSAYVMAVAKRTGGPTYWEWQIRLRSEGEANKPKDWPPREDLTVPRY